jgi:putative inorganic carbon (hco3(-)) transporter
VVALLQSRRLLIGLLAGVCAVAIAVPSVGARFADLSEPVQDNGTPGNSLSWRWQYWTEAVQLSRESPVSGIGLKMVATEADEGKQPHNDIIRAYVELGVLGLLAYVGLLVAFVRTAMAGLRAAPRRRGPSLDRGISVGFAGVVTAFIVLSLVANVMSQVVLLWYFLSLAGLTLTVVSRDARTEPAEGHTAEGESSADPARQ